LTALVKIKYPVLLGKCLQVYSTDIKDYPLKGSSGMKSIQHQGDSNEKI
jgi:hypothetical protein